MQFTVYMNEFVAGFVVNQELDKHLNRFMFKY